MSKTVYIVHCIDTEGPMYEAPEVPFEQLKKVFGIEIEPTEENLSKLRNGEIDLGGSEEAVKNLLDIHKTAVGKDWNMIEQMLQKVTSDKFRNQYVDSNGNGWIYSWFCLDHVGFTGENPRQRDLGHHKVFDKYMKMVKEQNKGDIVELHHHPISFSGNANECGTAYWGRSTLNDILSRKIIDRQWFPVAFRPGFHVERADSHWFLEQWIPFDYGNQAVKGIETNQPDMSEGRFGDWRLASKEWKPYHPSYRNYQLVGECKRWITRCLNMYARLNEITQEDVNDAFELSLKEGKSILAFTDHDFKDMGFDVNRVRKFIERASKSYPEVRFEFVDAITAMRKYFGLIPKNIGLECDICKVDNGMKLNVQTKTDIFGTQPYLAIKTKDGKYLWDNFDNGLNNKWNYTFDYNSISFHSIERIGVAVSNQEGVCEIMNYENEKWKKVIRNGS